MSLKSSCEKKPLSSYKFDVFIEQDTYLVEGVLINEDTSLREALQQIIDNLTNFQDLKQMKRAIIANTEPYTNNNSNINSDNSYTQYSSHYYGYNSHNTSWGRNIIITFLVKSKEDSVWHPLRGIHQLEVDEELKIITSAADFPSDEYHFSPSIEVDIATTNMMRLRRREVLSDED